MKSTLIIDIEVKTALSNFSSLIKDSKELNLKLISSQNFKIASKSNFDGLSVLEKEKYFINGQFGTLENKLVIDYTVRANSTFRTVAIISPFMSFPTFAMAFVKTQPQTGSIANPVTNLIIYFLFNLLFISFLLYKDYKLRELGKHHFESILSKMSHR